jgi:hypothetical protein
MLPCSIATSADSSEEPRPSCMSAMMRWRSSSSACWRSASRSWRAGLQHRDLLVQVFLQLAVLGLDLLHRADVAALLPRAGS